MATCSATLSGTNASPSAAATSAAPRDPMATGRVRRPITRSPGSSSTSFTISRMRWSHAASVQGTSPLAGRPTASAPYRSGRPATSATAAFPANPRRFSTGEYSIITPSAPSPTNSAVPLTSAAAPSPTSVPPTTHRSAVPRARRPAASGRPEGPRFTRSAAASQISFTAFPAAPNPTAATAANSSSLGVASAPSAIHPPASTPAAATRRLWARISRRTSITEHVPIKTLVAGHDALRGELGRPRYGGPAHALVGRGLLEQGHGALDHLVHPAVRAQIPRLAVHHHLREAALAGRHDGDSARHRLERRQPERLALRRQQEQIPTLQQLGDPVDLAEEAHVGTQLQPMHLLLGQVPLGPVTREDEGRRERAPHSREHLDHICDPLDRTKVGHVEQDLVVRRGQRAAARAVRRRVELGGRDEVGNYADVASGAPEGAIGLVPEVLRDRGHAVGLLDRELGDREVRRVLADERDVGAVQRRYDFEVALALEHLLGEPRRRGVRDRIMYVHQLELFAQGDLVLLHRQRQRVGGLLEQRILGGNHFVESDALGEATPQPKRAGVRNDVDLVPPPAEL